MNTELILKLEMLVKNSTKIFKLFDLSTSIIFFPLGIVLNLFSIFIFLRKKFQKNKVGFLNIILIISQTLGLIFGLLIYSLLPSIGFNLDIHSNINCKLLRYCRRIFGQFASWCQVLLTIDLFLFTKFSRKYRFFKKKRNLLLSIIIIFIMLMIINIADLFYELKETTYNNKTYRKGCRSNSSTVMLFSRLPSILFRNWIPFCILMFLSIFIFKSLLDQRRKISHNHSIKKEIQFLITIIFMNTIFFFFYTPLSVIYIIDIFDDYLTKTAKYYSYEKFEYSFNLNTAAKIAMTISFIYYSLPFFINCIFNKLFRNEVLEFFGLSKYFKNKIGISSKSSPSGLILNKVEN